jgi:hypothetical protein
MPVLYIIVGEHVLHRDRFLVLGDDGAYYIWDVAMGEPVPEAQVDQRMWRLDAHAIGKGAVQASAA